MIGVGIDSVGIERFRKVVERTPRLVERVFTPGERAYAQEAVDPIPRYAVRFALKEAVMKAMSVGLGAFAFDDVQVVTAPSGAPSVELRGAAAKLAERLGVEEWKISLTHTDEVATAIAIAL